MIAMSADLGPAIAGDGATLPQLAEQANYHHEQCTAAASNALEHALRAGELLLKAKGLVDHGEWLPWLEKNFQGSQRTAQVYMGVARDYPKLGQKRRGLRI